MQRPTLRTGDAVTIRNERWRVAATSTYAGSALLDVDGCDKNNRGTRARFILPFEPVAAERPLTSPPRIVTLSRWRRTARAILADAVPDWASLRAAASADFTILPFQLEPAIAVTRGDAVRVLIADEVGLGKTIQAGLIVAETIARSPDARVLVVSPAGLRDQWRDELRSRFQLTPALMDAEGVARSAACLVPDVNPWSIHQVVITSIDYVKRPEVMRALETLTWDVMVFDEAHALAGRSDRASAAAVLALRARVVVMLTATPHSGEEEAYAKLCAIGELHQSFPVMTFHRDRSDIGLPHARRSTQLWVKPTAGEQLMHHALARYAERLTDRRAAASAASGLVAAVLARRACSSAASLMRSLERRMALLTDGRWAAMDQLTLPFADAESDDQPGAELGIPGLLDTGEEMALLRHLTELAHRASHEESKLVVLTRLIRRAREPALVFTEYRDTLRHISAALGRFSPLELHGGLTARERADVIRQFAGGHASLLVATDAASEGLNLHHRCRLVVNLELPWTPLRLEQRIGRVDRLGQTRRVHSVQLVASGTAEEALAGRHDSRTASIRAAFNARRGPCLVLGDAAREEARRIVTARTLARDTRARSPEARVLTVRKGSNRVGRIWVFRLSCTDADGHLVFQTVAGLEDAGAGRAVGDRMDARAASHHAAVLRAAQVGVSAWVEQASHRERAIMLALRESHARLAATILQPGLFDRRAERAAAAQASRLEEAVRRSDARLAALDRARHLRTDERAAVFGILFRA